MDITKLKGFIENSKKEIESLIMSEIKGGRLGGVSKLAAADKRLDGALEALEVAVEKAKPKEKKVKDEKKESPAAKKN